MQLEKIPNHIGIIMDGNRRFAKSQGFPSVEGHRKGTRTFLDTVKWAKELGVKELTFYAFSTENFRRSKAEVDSMMKLFKEFAQKLLKKIQEKAKDMTEAARIRFVGLLDLFPKSIQELMHKIMDATKSYSDVIVNVAVGYGGKSELISAFKKLHKDVKSGKKDISTLSEDDISKHLFVPSNLDMVIRTGGTKRLSNFLLWQASYAELYFLDVLWPNFSKKDLTNCLEDYSGVKINLGA